MRPAWPADIATAARILPAALVVTGVVAVVCALTDVRTGPLHGVRAAVTVVFLVLGPGWALAGFLTARSLAERFVVAVGTGVAVTILAAQAMAVTLAWAPVGLLYPVALVTVPVLVRHVMTPDAGLPAASA